MAHAYPFLVVYDNETEGVFAISVPSKATRPWVVEYMKSVIYELGYGEIKICIKSVGARELHVLRRLLDEEAHRDAGGRGEHLRVVLRAPRAVRLDVLPFDAVDLHVRIMRQAGAARAGTAAPR